MNHSADEIPELVKRLEGVLLLLDEGQHLLPAIKVEEAILALQQIENQSDGQDNDL